MPACQLREFLYIFWYSLAFVVVDVARVKIEGKAGVMASIESRMLGRREDYFEEILKPKHEREKKRAWKC